jgi:hypothetical protein
MPVAPNFEGPAALSGAQRIANALREFWHTFGQDRQEFLGANPASPCLILNSLDDAILVPIELAHQKLVGREHLDRADERWGGLSGRLCEA